MNYRCSQKKQNPEVYYVKLFYHLQHLQLISVVSSDISHNIPVSYTHLFGLQHNPVSLPVTTTSSFIILAKGFTPRKYGFIP